MGLLWISLRPGNKGLLFLRLHGAPPELKDQAIDESLRIAKLQFLEVTGLIGSCINAIGLLQRSSSVRRLFPPMPSTPLQSTRAGAPVFSTIAPAAGNDRRT